MERTDYDTVFSCPVCLGPKQGIVFGLCQHFVCADCLYDPVQLSLQKAFRACPICKAKDVFPVARPDIPEATKQFMAILGVVKCNRKRCGEEMWTWDREQHESMCQGISLRGPGRQDSSPSRGSCSHKAEPHNHKRSRRGRASSKVN